MAAAAKETPRWTPRHTHTDTLTQTNTPSITGFCHKSKSGRRRQEGGGARWRKEATLSKCRNQGQDTEINLIEKLKHTLLYLLNQTYGTILSALHFD